MASIEPDPKRMQAFLESPAAGAAAPLVMINLLRYRERAEYPAGSEATTCSGREAYQRYGQAVAPLLAKAGARLLWMGQVSASVVAPKGEEWDDAVLVEYPSRDAFLRMVGSEEYQAISGHRTAGLADSRLIATTPHANLFES